MINVLNGIKVTSVSLGAEANVISGKGNVTDIYITADNCEVNIIDAYVKIDKAEGTKIFGNDILDVISTNTSYYARNDKSTTKDGNAIHIGDYIVNSDFEDGKYGVYISMGGGNTLIVKMKDGNKALSIYNRMAQNNGAGYNFSNYLGNNMEIMVQADIMGEVGGNYKVIMKTNLGDSIVAEITNAEANNWYTLSGTFRLDETLKYANLYFEIPGISNYYLDNVKIVIGSLPISVKGIFIEEKRTLKVGDIVMMKFDTFPTNAETGSVTWTSSNPEIAAVDPFTGKIEALKKGNTVIKVTAKNKVDEYRTFTDTCEVTVE